MITREEAVSIAKESILGKMGWSEFPSDAYLKSAYFNPDRQRWVFEWKKRYGLFRSEVDRILVWLSPRGRVIKQDMAWQPEVEAEMKATEQARENLVAKVREVEGISVEIKEYRKIDKDVWKHYIWIPKMELKDCYWIGVRKEKKVVMGREITDERVFLIDTDGRIVGELVMPTALSTATAGHYSGPDYVSELDGFCAGWKYLVEDFGKYFRRWDTGAILGEVPDFGYDKQGNKVECEDGFLTLDDYENSVKNPSTKIYFCSAHGASDYFYFIPYTEDTCYDVGRLEQLMGGRGPMRLAFLIHCGAMDSTGEGTIEYCFRKGRSEGTCTIGLKHTTDSSWVVFHDWYPSFLEDIDKNKYKPIKDAYEDACDEWPDIRGHIGFTGDPNLTLAWILGWLPVPIEWILGAGVLVTGLALLSLSPDVRRMVGLPS